MVIDDQDNETRFYYDGHGNLIRTDRVPDTVTTPITRHWFHSDHLGSLIGITDSTGTLVEEYAYDAWGNRLDPTDWAGDPTSFNTDLTDRGFTGHEMMDAVGLVNMNGRIYDPALGRFLSADPYVQFPENFQNYNRYTYVNNNPVSFNDPSGHYLSILTGIIGGVAGWGATTLIVAVSVAAAVQTFVRGGSLTEALKAGIFTALAAWVGGEIGSIFDGTKEFIIAASKGTVNWGVEIARAAAHGITQGGFAELQGGDFGSSFLAAFAGSVAIHSGPISGLANKDNITARTIAAAIVGGTTSELAGGKFSNGAITASIVHLFNQEEVLKGQIPQFGDIRNYYVTSLDVTYEGLTGEEYLEKLAVPAAALSGLLAVSAVPAGGLVGRNAAESTAGVVSDVVEMAIGNASNAPDVADAIKALPGIVKYKWKQREFMRKTNNLEIRVQAQWEVYVKDKILWFDGWAKRSGTFRYQAGVKGRLPPSTADFQKAKAAARKDFLK